MTTKTTPPADFFGPLQQEINKTLSTANESVLEAMKSVEDAKATARNTIAQIDADIKAMTDAHANLIIGSVNQKEVAAHLAAAIRASVNTERNCLMHSISRAKNLRAHKNLKQSGGMIANGRFVFEEKNKEIVSLYDNLKDGFGVFALMVEDEQIDALAEKLAKQVGAKEEGPSTDELQEQANNLCNQIEALQDQRFDLKTQLEKFIEIRLSPFANSNESEKFAEVMQTGLAD